MIKALVDDVPTQLSDYTNINYQEFRQKADIAENFVLNEIPAVYPWTMEQINDMNAIQTIFLMVYFSYYLRTDPRQLAIEQITMAYCALAKRGQVTDETALRYKHHYVMS